MHESILALALSLRFLEEMTQNRALPGGMTSSKRLQAQSLPQLPLPAETGPETEPQVLTHQAAPVSGPGRCHSLLEPRPVLPSLGLLPGLHRLFLPLRRKDDDRSSLKPPVRWPRESAWPSVVPCVSCRPHALTACLGKCRVGWETRRQGQRR